MSASTWGRLTAPLVPLARHDVTLWSRSMIRQTEPDGVVTVGEGQFMRENMPPARIRYFGLQMCRLTGPID
jgi:hypothetical protein